MHLWKAVFTNSGTTHGSPAAHLEPLLVVTLTGGPQRHPAASPDPRGPESAQVVFAAAGWFCLSLPPRKKQQQQKKQPNE